MSDVFLQFVQCVLAIFHVCLYVPWLWFLYARRLYMVWNVEGKGRGRSVVGLTKFLTYDAANACVRNHINALRFRVLQAWLCLEVSVSFSSS